MPSHLLVEPLASDDILAVTGCLILDALCFPRPGFVAARDLTRPGFRAWVCRSTETPSPWGFLGCTRVRDSLHVSAVATHPDFRRQGVAFALMRTAILQARHARLARVVLEVSPDNEGAVALYQKLGFTISNRVPGYYGAGEDALVMTLPLAQPKTRLKTRS
ncbi:MAG: GNAT family N-acetyltransferase [Polyangiaceae bacterium]|jgi:ribosomal protein S18 acetylase RimI-like enzyme|nr:GNAT family N-acetyltransferase [Polyangiaceae bacterium]